MGVIKMSEVLRAKANKTIIKIDGNDKPVLPEIQPDNVLTTKDVNRTWEKLQTIGKIDGQFSGLGPYENIKNAWLDEPAFVVAGSYGLRNMIDEGFEFSMLDNFHTIGVNHVVEDYDNLEWLLYIDQRYEDVVKYDLSKFKGRILASNKTSYQAHNVTRFKFSNKVHPLLSPEHGIYHGTCAGICALHFALIAGADPIYLLGCDQGGKTSSEDGAHYKDDYTGEIKGHKGWEQKYIRVREFFQKEFARYSERIINVDPLGLMTRFKKMHWKAIPELKSTVKKAKKKRIEILQKKKICHVGVMDTIMDMGTISRQVFNKTNGTHTYYNLKKETKLPAADIYLLECFKNSHEYFLNFQKPEGSKVVSLVHSSAPCLPAKCSDAVITLTKYWQDKLLKENNIKSEFVYGAIDCDYYHYSPDYGLQTFGRITRNAPGKIHEEYFPMVKRVLNKYKSANCIMYVNKNDELPIHERIVCDTTIKINETTKKAKYLANLSIATFAHGDFEEIFPLAVLESMATGLPIIALHQPSMAELIGDKQIIVYNMQDFEKELVELLPDTERKKELGRAARIRAQEFTLSIMIDKYNNIFERVLNI